MARAAARLRPLRLALFVSGIAPWAPVEKVFVAAVGIHLSRLLHDAVPSQVRTGVSSGAATLSWLTFLPCSMIFGARADDARGRPGRRRPGLPVALSDSVEAVVF